jgi:hypothetical protein
MIATATRFDAASKVGQPRTALRSKCRGEVFRAGSTEADIEPAAIFSPIPRSIRSMIDFRRMDHARTTARRKEAISWPLEPGSMRD